jgi:hypothetical protein
MYRKLLTARCKSRCSYVSACVWFCYTTAGQSRSKPRLQGEIYPIGWQDSSENRPVDHGTQMRQGRVEQSKV